jgi:hypothetical protein
VSTPGLIRRRPVPSDSIALVVMAAVVLWTALVLGPFVGIALPVPSKLFLPALFGYPIVMAIAVLVGARRAHPIFGPAATWTTLLFLALMTGIMVEAVGVYVLVLPAVFLGTFVVSRFRKTAVVAAFFLAGMFGTITALTPIRPGPAVDVVIGGLILGTAARSLTQRRSTTVVLWPGVALLSAYLLISALMILTAPTLEWGLLAFRSAAWYLLAGLVIAYLPWSRDDLSRIAKGFVVVGALVVAYGILRWRIGPSQHEWRLAISSASVYNFVDGRLRVFGSFTSGHELAAWSAAVVPFLAAYAMTWRNRWGALAAVAATGGIVVIFATEVRTGLAAVAVGLAIVLVVYQASRGFQGLHLGVTALIVVVALIAGIGAYSAVVGGNAERGQRFANILTPDQDPAYQARLVKWRSAVADLTHHPLGFGIGTAGRVQRRSGRFITDASVNVDSGYLKIAWEQGYAVLALYVIGVVALLAGLLRRAILTRDRERAGMAAGAAGAVAALGILLFTATYDEGLTALATWMIVGLGIAQFVRPNRADQYSP